LKVISDYIEKKPKPKIIDDYYSDNLDTIKPLTSTVDRYMVFILGFDKKEKYKRWPIEECRNYTMNGVSEESIFPFRKMKTMLPSFTEKLLHNL